MDTPSLSVLLRHKADKRADRGGTLYWVSPETGAAEAARLMDESNVGCVLVMDHSDRRVRHLPVVDGDELLGLISIGGLVRLVVEDKEREIADLMNFIQG